MGNKRRKKTKTHPGKGRGLLFGKGHPPYHPCKEILSKINM
jgi:hypothetical protein